MPKRRNLAGTGGPLVNKSRIADSSLTSYCNQEAKIREKKCALLEFEERVAKILLVTETSKKIVFTTSLGNGIKGWSTDLFKKTAGKRTEDATEGKSFKTYKTERQFSSLLNLERAEIIVNWNTVTQI